jgi:beta-phosphoglucomutase-like phosphatase (HAD superfamily)
MAGRADVSRTLVIFDVDGTLIDSMALEAACYGGALRAHLGLAFVDVDWSSYTEATDPGIVAELYRRHRGRPPAPRELAAFHDDFVAGLGAAIAADPASVAEIPGARRLLARLRAHPEFALAIATGAWRQPILLKLAAAAIAIDGLPFACADDAVERHRIVALAAARAAGPFARTVLVGDGAWDVAAARALGFGFVGVGHGGAAERLRAAGAATVLADFRDADALIDAVRTARVPG